jgi:hypothetical protein
MTVQVATRTRTVIVIDRELPKGLAANTAAVLSMTLGAQHPALVGDDFTDASGDGHVGLFPTGLPVLGAATHELPALRAAARERGLFVAGMPSFGHQTNDYGEFRAAVAATQTDDLVYLGILVSGDAKAVRAVTGQLGLLR